MLKHLRLNPPCPKEGLCKRKIGSSTVRQANNLWDLNTSGNDVYDAPNHVQQPQARSSVLPTCFLQTEGLIQRQSLIRHEV
jgi:hypothetical protein